MKAIPNQPDLKPVLFTGFPYILSRFTGELYHVILLPKHKPEQLQVAWHLAVASKLPTLLIKSDYEALYVDITSCPAPAIPASVPRPRYIAFGKLVTKDVIPADQEILNRYMALSLYAEYLHGPGSAYYVGNVAKGGRPATDDEVKILSGRLSNGVPTGLRQCRACGHWHGICLDTDIPRLLVEVNCQCENRNRCARCDQLLYNRKLNSNYYSPEDGRIWHVPGFYAANHECPQATEAWITEPRISLRVSATIH